MKSKLLGAAVLCVAAIATVAVVTANAGSNGDRTFKLVEKDQSFHFNDVPPLGGNRNSPPSAGDSFQFSSTLWTPVGKRTGTLNVGCVITVGGKNGVGHCEGTFTLPGGTIEGAATTSISGNAPNHVAILGGTGAYEGASGTVVSAQTKTGANDTVHLILP